MDVGKVYPVGATGSPLRSKSLILITLLLEAGYPLATTQTNFEDSVDLATGERKWVFLFDGSHARKWGELVDLLPKQAADYFLNRTRTAPPCEALAHRAALCNAYGETCHQLASSPPHIILETALVDVGGFDHAAAQRIADQHLIVCDAVKNAPKHVIAHRGRARYWIPAELSETERETAIDRLAREYRPV